MNKRIVFTQGNKGGTGKTTVISALIDWYRHHDIPIAAVDFDSENQLNSGLSYFQKGAQKIKVDMRDGLDEFIRLADETDAAVIVADMGAGFGAQTFNWFDLAYEDIKAMGVVFTSFGVVTDDPGSVTAVLTWHQRLKDRTNYLIVLNEHETPGAEFEYWHHTVEATNFRETAKPEVVKFISIHPDVQRAIRNHGESLLAVAGKTTGIDELKGAITSSRASRVIRSAFAEFDRVRHLLLPTLDEQPEGGRKSKKQP
jgi:MinD-like ATPase involved in chromosome partitioning or flagellar assembly